MKRLVFAPLLVMLLCPPATFAQSADSSKNGGETIKANVDEVILDIVVRDKKGKPITDLKPSDIAVTDGGTKQTLRSFRFVHGAEAISESGVSTPLDALHQVRLVTLAFEPMSESQQRKTAHAAAIDLIKGEQGTNVFYSVVVINTRLLVLQQFTNDKAALEKAIDKATTGLAAGALIGDSDSIKAEIQRNLNGATIAGSAQGTTNLSSAAAVANAPNPTGGPPTDPTGAMLMRVMLDMLRMDTAAAGQGTRLSLAALKSLVLGLQEMPGRKSVLYFTQGMYRPPELDVMFQNLTSLANRANVTFYSVDTRGVMTFAQNAGAMGQLNSATASTAAATTTVGSNIDQALAGDNAETAGRENLQLPIRDLAEATGGFLVGDSNDLRSPLRHINEEISSYYEVTFNPGIQNYDGSFRKLNVTGSKDLVIHARNGYFALPPEARAAGLQTYEIPLLQTLSDNHWSTDVMYRASGVLLQPKNNGTDLAILVEVPLRSLQDKIDPVKNTHNVHCSLAALVKDSSGAVVQKITRDRSFQVTADQLKYGNFVEKMTVNVPPGTYMVESAVMDRESGKIGAQESQLVVAPKEKGVGISSLSFMRAYTPNAKGLDADEPFQYQGGSVTPTLSNVVPRTKDSMLRLFFTIYKDPTMADKPTVDIAFLLNGQTLQKAPLPLPEADAQGRIQYVMTIAAEAIPPGTYEIQATAHQGNTSSQAKTTVKIEAGS